jgi:type VI protein secretion system component VasK
MRSNVPDALACADGQQIIFAYIWPLLQAPAVKPGQSEQHRWTASLLIGCLLLLCNA